MATYTKVKQQARGFKRKDKDARWTCVRGGCGRIATVRAINSTHLKVTVHYCADHAEEGGVV